MPWFILAGLLAAGVVLLGQLMGVSEMATFALAAMMLLAAVMCRRAAVDAEEQRVRAGWNWMMLAMAVYAVHHLLTPLQSTGIGRDIGIGTMVLSYAFALVSLGCAVRIPREMLARLFLDTGVVLAGTVVITVKLLQNTSISVSGADLANAVLYRPLMDLAILSLIAIALASISDRARLFPALIRGACALGLLFAAHLWVTIAFLRGDQVSGGVNLLFAGAGMMIALAAHSYVRYSDAQGALPTALSTADPLAHNFWFHVGNAVVPYTIAMSAATVLVLEALLVEDAAADETVLIAGALAFVVVGGLRQILSHIENRNLYREMSELNSGLESLVQYRTAELVRRNEELEAVHNVATVSAASFDLKTILQAVAEQLTQVVGASQCVIHERSVDGVSIAARYERGGVPGTGRLRDPLMNLLQLPRSEFQPVGTRSSVVMRWTLDDDDPASEILDYHGATVALLVPMVARDQTVGVAEIYRTSAEPFSEGDVSLAEAVTTQAALATDNARAFGNARFAANHDPVTGLLNHRALHEELGRMFEVASRTGRPLTVLMMDLNLFKEFNDRFGHQAGDAVLTDIANAINASVPKGAATARYGGDEFTVIIPDFPARNVPMIVSAIRERVARIQDRYGFVGEGFGIAAGIASYPEDGSFLNLLIAQADERMYEDKRRLKGYPDRRRRSVIVPEHDRDASGIPIDTNL